MHILEKKACRPQTTLSSREEMMHALELMLRRMDAIDARCTDGFPLYSPGEAGQWVTSPGGSWVGGFWGGWWWLRSRLTGSAADMRKAAEISRRLSSKTGADSINRSLIFWYGAALGDLWFGDIHAHALTRESIVAIAASYDPEMNCIPLGPGMGGGKEGHRLITLDTLASLIQLLNRSEHSVYHHISRCHADTLLAACRTGNGAFHTAARFEQGSFRPVDQAGVWSRGQAWAMLGLSRAAAQWGEPYLTHAQSACAYWKRSRPDPFPANRLGHPAELCDPSSAVIASLAMLSLAKLMPGGRPWRTHAHRQVTAILRSRYFIGLEEHEEDEGHEGDGGYPESGEGTASGIFRGCCYKTHSGTNELVESVWGSFFLMATLCVLVDAIEPNHC
jgi:unsaturated chondroitin disaccharide hydrolase